MSIQKEQIIQAAITLLDRDGLEGVTLRRLAKELDIKAASIYWHIANKEELLDEMANAILQEHFGTFDFKNDKRDWAEWLDILAHELRAAMVAHREGARVVAGA
ncbi:MAG TPA: TetR family transcriptional regulator, partial [Anaerolineae bacterium]|nr:TetR family transcriptional regulator [Anaerolineae bacterium]